jgi:hypothetical protein
VRIRGGRKRPLTCFVVSAPECSGATITVLLVSLRTNFMQSVAGT